jgi:hypothetical protein
MARFAKSVSRAAKNFCISQTTSYKALKNFLHVKTSPGTRLANYYLGNERKNDGGGCDG